MDGEPFVAIGESTLLAKPHSLFSIHLHKAQTALFHQELINHKAMGAVQPPYGTLERFNRNMGV